MITWKYHKKTESVIMVYGFSEDSDRHYSAVLTLCIKGDSTFAYGFLEDKSKLLITLENLWGLWDTLCGILPTRYLVFEALPEHAAFYKHKLPVVATENTTTFNGIESEVLTIELKKVER